MSYSKTINKLTFNNIDTPISDIIGGIIDKNKDSSFGGNIVSKTARKLELSSKQDNTNAVLLDNQKAQEKMLKDIENLGWRLDKRVLVSELAREGEGAGATAAVAAGESTPGKYRYTFTSLILDANGSPTEVWDSGSEGYGTFPTTYPVGWSPADLVYDDGVRIPDEVMANELARNQTPNNWMSSYINIYQEYQRITYKKKMMEEAKEQAEQGIAMGAHVSSPSYPDVYSPYNPSSPGYTASTPVYGSPVYGSPESLSYGAMAAASAAAAVAPGEQSPMYTPSSPVVKLGNVLTPVVFQSPLSPLQQQPLPQQPLPQQPPQQQPSSILEVKVPETKDSSDGSTGGGGGGSGAKTVMVSQSFL